MANLFCHSPFFVGLSVAQMLGWHFNDAKYHGRLTSQSNLYTHLEVEIAVEFDNLRNFTSQQSS